MTCSVAKLEANQRNAALSSGPRTPEGKAVSRGNSFKHGLTGGGIVLPPADVSRIAAVAQDLRNQYHPTTETGQAMADHAAILLIRLDRAGRHELAMVADQIATALFEFDQFRRDWADNLFDSLPDNPAALDELRGFPEGIDRLIAEWRDLDTIPTWSITEFHRAAMIWDAGPANGPSSRVTVAEELRKLEVLKLAIDLRPIERARQQAVDLALFSDSPEAILARKYEASTERAYHKAIKTLKEAAAPQRTVDLPEIPTPAHPLGSFSPPPPPPPKLSLRPEPAVAPLDPKPPIDRARRPDPKKLREAQRRKGR